MFRTVGFAKRITASAAQVRFLNLQEFQSKGLLDKKGCTIQKFIVAENAEEIKQKLANFTHKEYVLKAQVLAGGRGKGRFVGGPPDLGGVYLSTKKDEILNAASTMLGKRLVTKQTPKDGVLVNKVMIAQSINITRETYVAILMDRETNGPVFVVSPIGGMDIEDVAKNQPEAIHKIPINILTGVTEAQGIEIAKKLNFADELLPTVGDQLRKLYDLFLDVDATQVEINPLAETDDNKVYFVDAKFNFDDSAAFRQKEIFAMENHEGEDPREVEAKKYNLNYIGLDGNIACLVNGAGLAMATMDIIKLCGGSPANFLDVGGTATEDQVYHAFEILRSHPNVKGILVNIFGGIVNCATIANGLIKAFERSQLSVPLVVRLEGTNVDNARKILKDSGLPIIAAADLEDAAKKVVQSIA